MSTTTTSSSSASALPPPHQHGVKGVFYGGDWLDIEDCPGRFLVDEATCSGGRISQSEHCSSCPRSASRNAVNASSSSSYTSTSSHYDIVIIGAGCIGAAIARELSKYKLKVLWCEAADDVAQGATKGNSGIVHAGYDDTPNTNRAKYCWPGNQMFPQLDQELRFGYQKNGSLVLATTAHETEHLYELKARGEINGVQRLEVITDVEKLRHMEPYLHPNVKAALYAPDAGNVIPYEYTIALAENAVDNGVELRIRRRVTQLVYQQYDQQDEGKADHPYGWTVTMDHWEPPEYVQATTTMTKGGAGLSSNNIDKSTPKSSSSSSSSAWLLYSSMATAVLAALLPFAPSSNVWYAVSATLGLAVSILLVNLFTATSSSSSSKSDPIVTRNVPLSKWVQACDPPKGRGDDAHVNVPDMLVGGSGSKDVLRGVSVGTETVRAKYVINCAGGAADQIARLIGDDSFTIQPRLGDYLLLNRNQGHLAKRTLFPCPDPVLGKGVLVQTTLWGNLILGPTARDVYKPEARDMSPAAVQEYILSKCKQLVPTFDAKETFHAFCGARAKSTRGDWIIEPSSKNPKMILVAGIDSPGLAGSPAIALQVIKLLQQGGLAISPNPTFNPNRAPIITPKLGMRGLKIGPVEKNDTDGIDEQQMAQNVICKCEKVTELEVVRALRRSLPIDSTQGIRKRTRAGMGHCQGDASNYNCEARVRAIIARENGVPLSHVGTRPWPATSTLPQRWITEEQKEELQHRMNSD